MKWILEKFKAWKIPFTLNTDGPYLLRTHLSYEATMLLDAGVLTQAEVHECFDVAKRASFIQ